MTYEDSTRQPVDYLGHPCAIAEAQEYFSEPLDLARTLGARELREVARQIGKHLNELSGRICHLDAALRLVRDALPNDDCSDGTRAVLEMAQSYTVQTANEFFEFAGLVLVSMEQERVPEVAHG